MIDLVLQTGGQQAVALQFALCAGFVEVADFHPRRPGDVGILAGKGQAAFLPRGEFLTDRDDLRVDEAERLPSSRPASGQ